MISQKKTHSYWGACHIYFRFSETSIRVEKFSELTCKFCIKKNQEREQDPVISISHNNGMAIMKFIEHIDYLETEICFSCNKDHSVDMMYVFQTRYQCSTCVLSNFIKPEVIEKMNVNCRRCDTDFDVIPSQDRNWNSLSNFIQCPRCDIQFGFDQENDNDWDSDICVLNVQIKSDIKIVNNLEIPLLKDPLHSEELWNDPTRCLECGRDLSVAQQKQSNYCCKDCYINTACGNKNCDGLKKNPNSVPIEVLSNNQNYSTHEDTSKPDSGFFDDEGYSYKDYELEESIIEQWENDEEYIEEGYC